MSGWVWFAAGAAVTIVAEIAVWIAIMIVAASEPLFRYAGRSVGLKR